MCFLHSVFRKERCYDDVNCSNAYDNDHVYGNMEVCKRKFTHSLFTCMREESANIFPIQNDLDDTIYANM